MMLRNFILKNFIASQFSLIILNPPHKNTFKTMQQCANSVEQYLQLPRFQWKFKTSFTDSTGCHVWFFRCRSRYIFSFKSYFIIIQGRGWVTLCVKLLQFLFCPVVIMYIFIKIKNARIRIFTDPYSLVYGRIRVSENLYFRILYAVIGSCFYLFAVDNYTFRVGGGDSGAMCRICQGFTVKITKQSQLKRFWYLYC